VEDDVDSGCRLPADVRRSDIALDEPEACPAIGAHDLPHLVQVGSLAGGEVVETDDLLIRFQQCLG